MSDGRPKEIEDTEFLKLLRERDKIALMTGEVADRLDIHRKTALRRLKMLEEHAQVDHDDMSHGHAWYLQRGDPFVKEAHSISKENKERGVLGRILGK